MKSAIKNFARVVCCRRREDELLLAYSIFVVCYVLFAR